MDRKAEAREADHQHAGRALHVYPDEDGTVRIRGRLAPEVGALLMQALAAAREDLYQRRADQAPEADPPTMEQQQADALALLAESALHHGIDPGAPGERYLVVVHVDAAVLADPDQAGQSVLEDGLRVPAGTSERLACDASRVVMRHDAAGRLLEVGARTRTIPPALRRALHHRDRGCRLPGCGLRFGQGHHIRHWARGGPTTLSNLALLCRRHHRAVHEEGYQVERQPDGELHFRRPDGRVLPEVPLPHEVPDDPVKPSERGTMRRGLSCTRGLRPRVGWGSAWTWAGRSTSCIPWRVSGRAPRGRAPPCSRARARRRPRGPARAGNRPRARDGGRCRRRRGARRDGGRRRRTSRAGGARRAGAPAWARDPPAPCPPGGSRSGRPGAREPLSRWCRWVSHSYCRGWSSRRPTLLDPAHSTRIDSRHHAPNSTARAGAPAARRRRPRPGVEPPAASVIPDRVG